MAKAFQRTHRSRMISSSARSKTLPVGLFGVFRMIALVFGQRRRRVRRDRISNPARAVSRNAARRRTKSRRPVIFVERLEDDHFVAGVDDGHHGGHDRFGGTAADGDFALGVDRECRGALEFFRNGIAQRFRAPGNRVLIDVRAMASCAAPLISAGAGKSGKPCERLTA